MLDWHHIIIRLIAIPAKAGIHRLDSCSCLRYAVPAPACHKPGGMPMRQWYQGKYTVKIASLSLYAILPHLI